MVDQVLGHTQSDSEAGKKATRGSGRGCRQTNAGPEENRPLIIRRTKIFAEGEGKSVQSPLLPVSVSGRCVCVRRLVMCFGVGKERLFWQNKRVRVACKREQKERDIRDP